jgi:hypothetical protein
MNIQNLRLFGIVFTVGVLLSIPYIAMKITGEMKWNWFDFLVAGVLLLGTGLACEAVLRIFEKTSHRIAICLVILAGLFVVWAELAVGIIGTPFAGS